MSKRVDEKHMIETAARVANWGRWGKDDEIGTLNFVSNSQVKAGARLVINGDVFPLGMNMDQNGPQRGYEGRVNPLHMMTWTGTDVVTGVQSRSLKRPHEGTWYGAGFSDDYITMPIQCATHWDALGHVFYQDIEQKKFYMYNGFDPINVNSAEGCSISGIEKYYDKMAGRGVLLDVARYKNVPFMQPGEGITCEDLDNCAKSQGVEIRTGDFILVRTGDSDRRIREKQWGTYCGSDAPGLEFETIIWLHDNEVAAVATDTWGCEVRPNNSDMFHQPWHQLCIPIAGLPMGENFRLDALADACAADKRYDFFFVAPPLLITGGTGSPLNPYAIR